LTSAVVITGAPGSGKSSVAQALTTLLDDTGIGHGARRRDPRVDLVLDTAGRFASVVAGELFEACVNGGWVGR
jgi:hypothetical protein